jgi:4-hydroxy 2-oxovalerate aldolase
MTDIRITDVTLRDGSHAVRHQFTVDQVEDVTRALAGAGVPVIEISHGDGLGGSSLTYGPSLVDERDLLRAAAPILRENDVKLAVLLLPGIGVATDLEVAAEIGASVARIATHCTEADIAAQHLAKARDLGLEAVGFLMMAHMISPEELCEQARIHEASGAQVVYCTDSAGALMPTTVAERVSALRAALEPSTVIGFHAHNNLGLGVANTIVAIEEGAEHVDASACGLGAGAGNCATEALVAVCDKLGWATGVDLMAVIDAAEDVVAAIPERRPTVDRASLILGWAGVYSSFLLHAQRAAKRYGVRESDILLELSRRRAVGGQEDMIVDVAIELAASQGGEPQEGSRS